MSATAVAPDRSLYYADETGWLERMARLIEEHRYDEIDFENLQEYLGSMAKRDTREVVSRLVVLMAHRLKWERQPEKRSPSWRLTIANQSHDLADLLESATLRRHAEKSLERAFTRAVQLAVIESGLFEVDFPRSNDRGLDNWIGDVEPESSN